MDAILLVDPCCKDNRSGNFSSRK